MAVLVVRTGPDARCPQPVAAAALLDRLRAEGRITHVAFAADTVPDVALRATAARLADSEHHGDPPVHVAVAPVVDAVKRIDGQRLVGAEDRTPLRWLDGLVVASASAVSSALERCAATGSGAEAHDWSPLELLRAPARVLASSILG